MSDTAKWWQQHLSELRERYIGGDIEEHATPEGTFRGPISEIRVESGTLIVSSPWCAHLERGGWVK